MSPNFNIQHICKEHLNLISDIYLFDTEEKIFNQFFGYDESCVTTLDYKAYGEEFYNYFIGIKGILFSVFNDNGDLFYDIAAVSSRGSEYYFCEPPDNVAPKFINLNGIDYVYNTERSDFGKLFIL